MISRPAVLNVIDVDVPTFILCMRTCLLNCAEITLDVMTRVAINNGVLLMSRTLARGVILAFDTMLSISEAVRLFWCTTLVASGVYSASIADIQGPGFRSPLVGQTVESVNGIVTVKVFFASQWSENALTSWRRHQAVPVDSTFKAQLQTIQGYPRAFSSSLARKPSSVQSMSETR